MKYKNNNNSLIIVALGALNSVRLYRRDKTRTAIVHPAVETGAIGILFGGHVGFVFVYERPNTSDRRRGSKTKLKTTLIEEYCMDRRPIQKTRCGNGKIRYDLLVFQPGKYSSVCSSISLERDELNAE